MQIEIAIFTAVILGVVAGLLLENMRRRIEPETAGAGGAKVAPLRLMGPSSARPAEGYARSTDSAADLRLVSDAGFASKPLLTGREADVLVVVESIAAEAGLGWRVVPQVRLIDILASSDADANAAIGDHRLDMLIVSANRMPVAAVDYQPLGQLRDDSAVRDAIKREALRRAAIPFLEIRANEPVDALREQILRLAAPPAKAVRVRAPVAARPAAKSARTPAATAKAATTRASKPVVVVAAPAVAAAAVAKPAARPAAKAAPKSAAKPAPAKAAALSAKTTTKTAKAAAKPVAKAVAKPPAAKPPAKDPPAEP